MGKQQAMSTSFWSISRTEILRPALRCQLSLLLQVVIDFECIQDGLVHVEVLVRRQTSNEAYLRPLLFLSQRPVLFVQGLVGWIRHGVVRIALRHAVLSCYETALDLAFLYCLCLIRDVLVFDDPREPFVGRGIVDNHRLLEKAPFRLGHKLLFEADGTILELGQALGSEVRIYWPCVHQEIVSWQPARVPGLEEVAVHADCDVRILQDHVLEDAGVATERKCLPVIRKVALVCVGPAGQAQHHRRVQLRGVLVPLLLGVVLEDGVVQVWSHAHEGCLLAVCGLASMLWLDANLVVVSLHLLLVGDVRSKQLVHCLLHGRYWDELLDAVFVGHPASHAVVKGDPLRELLDVVPHAVVLCVEQVRPILAGTDAVGCHIVVAVATDVVPLVEYEGCHSQLPGAPLRDHAAGQACSNDQQVDLRRAC
mmetsp:Transcript_20478/g.42470  ORF Transcript_20478/g.42470 Transcript_20478/m.42470 type:complete len:424 (+) Transcript_20478:135-1406(+)